MKETFQLWKKGNKLRLDCRMIEFKLKKTKNHKISIIFDPNDKVQNFVMINHNRKFFTNLIEELDQDEKQEIIYDLMKPKIKKTKFSVISFGVTESKGWFSKSITQKIQGFMSKKFELKLNYEAISINKFHKLISTKYDLYAQKEEEKNIADNSDKNLRIEDKIKRKIYGSNFFIWAAEKYPIKIKVYF